jgi:protein-S-isoprenylcysteine O-methyltransferase Ste14
MKLLIKGIISNVIFTLILFISAWKIDYVQGWIFLSVNIISTFLNVYTIRNNPDLANERSKLGEGIKSWDKLLLGLSAVIYLIMIVIAGLDSGRYLWSPEFSWIISIIGIVIMFIGQALFLTARSQNNFFSSVVRIQRERGHVVCDSGLY